MKKKIIIFDMDGVLFDTIPFAEEFFLKGHPGMTSEMYRDMHTGNFHEGTLKYTHLQKQETEEEKLKRHTIYAETKSKTPLFKGVKELLENLHNEGCLFVLNTNAYNRNCFPLLEKAEIMQLFDFLVTAEISKDKVEKFKLIEEKYKIDKKEMLFITDALGDVKDADIAGVPTIAVTWGVHNASFFIKEKYSCLIGIVDTVEELNNLIRKI